MTKNATILRTTGTGKGGEDQPLSQNFGYGLAYF